LPETIQSLKKDWMVSGNSHFGYKFFLLLDVEFIYAKS